MENISNVVEILAQVMDERHNQDAKFGEQNHPDGTGSDALKEAANHARWVANHMTANGKLAWRHILLEEVLEALAESNPDLLRGELLQVAAVAVAWIEAIDRRK